MTKATLRHPKQLEMPLLTNLNSKTSDTQRLASQQNTTATKSALEQSDVSLKATTDDLKIYRSISEGVLSRYR
jgi:hypothetical protein